MTKKTSKSSGSGKKAKAKAKYAMRLYITGATPRSSAAVTNLRKLCDKYLPGEYDLRIIDIYQQPQLASEGQVIAAPTLVKSFPLPLRRFIGDMSNTENLLAGLEIHSFPSEKPAKGRRKA
jgi:circadian clock protein KaiB